MKTKLIFGLLFMTLIFVSCSNSDETTNTETTGRLKVQLTDAPFPYNFLAEANVTVFKVEARRVEDENSDDDAKENSEGYPFITLMEEEIEVNLLELTNGITQQLADLEVPAGTYNLIRIYVKGVNVVLTDGSTYNLKVHSGEQTGIKVFIKPGLTVSGGISSDLLLDFDVSRSFVVQGNIDTPAGINGFIFKPVIKASNLSTSGTLFGNVSTLNQETAIPLEGTQISVFAADTLNTTGFTDANGDYTIMGLKAGTYKVLAELEGYIASDYLDIQIDAGNKTLQDFILEANTASGGSE
ncbi:DUF4382 domain-containing protein [Ascidiimonas aurantiaca]|uniref:DUF4382 domain-containing protein n=1 Tax=Ascidiimonas aurantiaca TaxID=1685432 RepID=UPI0030EF66F1